MDTARRTWAEAHLPELVQKVKDQGALVSAMELNLQAGCRAVSKVLGVEELAVRSLVEATDG